MLFVALFRNVTGSEDNRVLQKWYNKKLNNANSSGSLAINSANIAITFFVIFAAFY